MADKIIIGSRMPDMDKYGQNGWPGSSSDLAGQAPSRSGFLPAPDVQAAQRDADRIQKRDVGKSGVSAAFGMRRR